VSFQVEVCAMGQSLPTVMCLTECDLETSTMRRPRPTRAVKPRGKNILFIGDSYVSRKHYTFSIGAHINRFQISQSLANRLK
jgi:hypothetical protein